MVKKKNIGKIKIKEKSDVPKSQENSEENDVLVESDNEFIKLELEKIRKGSIEILKNNKELSLKEKFQKIQELSKKTIDENQELKNKINALIEKQKIKKPLKQKSTSNKMRDQIRRIEVAYIEYYPDLASKVYNWIPLHSIPAIIINPKKKELFLMDTPSKFLNGKSVYIFVKQIPFAIPLEFNISNLIEELGNMNKALVKNDKGEEFTYVNPGFELGRAYLSPTDCYAKYTSIRYQMIFGVRRPLLKQIAIHLLSFLMGIATLYMILAPMLFGGK